VLPKWLIPGSEKQGTEPQRRNFMSRRFGPCFSADATMTFSGTFEDKCSFHKQGIWDFKNSTNTIFHLN
jgi:hypothetical protein